MQQPGRGAYIGRSTEAEPEPDDLEGPTLRKAIRAAYRLGMADKPKDTGETFTFKVVGIRVEGTNPISDYIVDLDDD